MYVKFDVVFLVSSIFLHHQEEVHTNACYHNKDLKYLTLKKTINPVGTILVSYPN